MSVALMPPLEPEAPVPSREGPLARFWPRAREAPAAVLEGWRDSLTKFCPRSRRVPPREGPRRASGLRVFAPRRLRPGARPRSIGRVALSDRERRQLARDEAKTRRIRRRRPRVWGDCETGDGWCPWVSCSMHLYLEVDPDTGIIKLNFPDKQPHELEETCALRVVRDRGGLSLEETGKLVNLTQERVSQIEEAGFAVPGWRKLRPPG